MTTGGNRIEPGFLRKLWGLEPRLPTRLPKLVTATIETDEDHKYLVCFERNHPQLRMAEFVRLVLHYYAKMLFNFDPSNPSGWDPATILKKNDGFSAI